MGIKGYGGEVWGKRVCVKVNSPEEWGALTIQFGAVAAGAGAQPERLAPIGDGLDHLLVETECHEYHDTLGVAT